MHAFLSGAVFLAAILAGLFFLRFWKETQDRFFYLFALAFFLMAAERVPLIFRGVDSSVDGRIYIFRLCAFVLILAAIVEKNRKGRTT